ncbi:MAG TPA: Ig-like domain-containing protein [Gemmatimonadales bacterium]
MRSQTGSTILIAASALAGGGCDSAAPNLLQHESLPIVVSDPVSPAPVLSSGAVAGRIAASSGMNDGIAYVSAAAGTAVEALDVSIENPRLGRAVSATLLDGGFDPVPVPAIAGDTLALTFSFTDGTTSLARAAVPARRRPRVVRTQPVRGRTDVAINSVVRAIFSEPVDPATLGDSTVRLLLGNVAVAGTVRPASGAVLGVDFIPAQPLAPATTYRLVLDGGIRDVSGDPLEPIEPVEFTTFGQGGAAPLVVTVTTTGQDLDGDGYVLTLDARSSHAAGINETITLPGVGAGGHTLLIEGVADNCIVAGGVVKYVTVAADAPASVALNVSCVELPEVIVTVTTTGADLDPDGYSVQLDYSQVQTLPVNGSVTFRGGHYGSSFVWLLQLAGNCTADGPVRRTIEGMPGGGAITVAYSVTCSPDFVPSGTLAFAKYVDDGGSAIFVADADGSNPIRLTEGGMLDSDPAWSPDGTRLAFIREGADRTSLWVMNADGSGARMLADAPGLFVAAPAWMPGGRRIFFTANRRGVYSVEMIEADGTQAPEPVVISRRWTGIPAWSPDGLTLAMVRSTTLEILTPDGVYFRQVPFGFSLGDPSWSPDGRSIALGGCRVVGPDYFCAEHVLEIVGADGSVRTARPVEPWIGRPAWRPDGGVIAYSWGSWGPIEFIRPDGHGSTHVLDGFDPAWKP